MPPRVYILQQQQNTRTTIIVPYRSIDKANHHHYGSLCFVKILRNGQIHFPQNI